MQISCRGLWEKMVSSRESRRRYPIVDVRQSVDAEEDGFTSSCWVGIGGLTKSWREMYWGGEKPQKKTINLVTPPQLYCPERRTFLRFWRSWHGNMCCEDTASWFLVMMVMIFHVTVLFWKAFCRAECSQTASRVLRNLCHTRVLQLIIAQGTVTQHRLKVIKGNRVYFLSPVF